MNVVKSVLCVLVSIVVSSTFADRKLHSEFNPGCLLADHCASISKLVYICAEGDNDTVHFLFDFSAKPSLVVLSTDKDSVIQVNYTAESDGNNKLTKPIIQFTKPPKYTFASVFNKLYEFNDINDTAKMEDGKNFITMYFKQFNWKMAQLANHSDESVEVTISADSYRAVNISKSGTVSITLRVYGSKDQGPNFPHLIHTPESGELTLTLDQFKTDYTQSRFAVELLSFSSFPYNKSEDLSENSYSDDKLAGGTFYNYLVDAKGEDEEEGGGYMSWKPVVYRAAYTHALNSSSTTQYNICEHTSINDWINTPLFKLYGNSLFNNNFLKRAFNVSFGEPEDGFYLKSNYLYWTLSVGVGAPPNTSLGFFEMSIIASLLLMLTITMILVFCVFMRWVSSKHNSIIYGQ